MAKKARKKGDSALVDHDLQAQAGHGELPASEWVPIGEIKPDPRNENTHPEDQIKALVASIQAFDQTKPLIVNKRNNQVIAGNGTYQALLKCGKTHALVRWVDWTEKQQRDYRVVDNRSAQLSKFDPDLLAASLDAMALESGDLFAAMQLADLVVEETPPPPPLPPVDVPPLHAIFVECHTEAEQKDLWELLKGRGYSKMRVLTVAETKALTSMTSGN